MIALCDISAWEYWRTPPLLRYFAISDNALLQAEPEGSPLLRALTHSRQNTSAVERLVALRLGQDLKGLSFPIHIMTDEPCRRARTDFLHIHRIPKALPSTAFTSIDFGLSVVSPTYCTVVHCQQRSVASIAKMMFEACGIFSICPTNNGIDLAIRGLSEITPVLREGVPKQLGIYGCYDASGRKLGFLDAEGNKLPWNPCIDRSGNLTDLWKRPPLTSVSDIAAACEGLAGLRYLETVQRALQVAHDGAASPEEVRAVMLLCSGAHLGGEAFEAPILNMTITYSEQARALAHRSFAIGDCMWPHAKTILEVNGEAFHADRSGFLIASGRRPALESMGYTLLELNHEQMANLELFDTMLPAFSKALQIPLRHRTSAFLRRRNQLHHELFELPYEPTWS